MTTRTGLLVLALLASCSPSVDPSASVERPVPPAPSPTAPPADEPALEPALHVEPAPEAPGSDGDSHATPPTASQLSAFASASNAFALDLYAEARQQEGNLAFSPASIALALQMTWAGAHGATADEMRQVLRIEAPPEGQHEAAGRILAKWNDPARETYVLRVVNRLFGQQDYDFAPDFLALTGARYGAPLEPVNFRGGADAARTRINGWVAQQTNARIDELLPAGSVDPQTRLVLVNAAYFLGAWKHGFSADVTRDVWFYGSSGRSAVRMMNQMQRHEYARVDGVQVLQMRYRGDELAMMLVLPDARDGLGALEASLDDARLERWVTALRELRVSVYLPRFEIANARLPLTETLPEMGMPLAFDSHRADFSGMVAAENRTPGLYLSDVFHEAFVKVDEEGTEAAAATAAVMRERSLGASRPVVFRADHPFLFFIRDVSSGTILFMGRVEAPDL